VFMREVGASRSRSLVRTRHARAHLSFAPGPTSRTNSPATVAAYGVFVGQVRILGVFVRDVSAGSRGAVALARPTTNGTKITATRPRSDRSPRGAVRKPAATTHPSAFPQPAQDATTHRGLSTASPRCDESRGSCAQESPEPTNRVKQGTTAFHAIRRVWGFCGKGPAVETGRSVGGSAEGDEGVEGVWVGGSGLAVA
jgi:hypothetical protein